jgi:hypothetical protein
VAVPPAPVRIPSHLPGVSRRSRLLANDKGDNEMILEAVNRFPAIYLTAQENSGKPQLGDGRGRLCDQVGPLPLNEASRIAQHVRKGERRKEVKYRVKERNILTTD